MPRNLSQGGLDGTSLGLDANDKISFYGAIPVPQPASPCQATVEPLAMGEIITWTANGGTLSAVGANTCANQALTCNGMPTTDLVVGVSKPTANAGVGIAGIRISAANTVQVNFCNPSTGSVTPTANEQYVITAVRGQRVHSKTLTPAAVIGGTMAEQTFSLGGSGAAATAVLNSNGTVKYISVTAAGSGYTTPPTVVISPPNPMTSLTVTTGTMSALPEIDEGQAATGQAILSSTGTVISVLITNPGSGYTTAPTVTFIGGVCIPKGAVLVVSKPTDQANLGIGNVRIISDNVVGITYFATNANVTPASQAYSFFALSPTPCINPIAKIKVTAANFTAAQANAANKTSHAIVGVAATDSVIGGGGTAALESPLAQYGGVCAANAVEEWYFAGVAGGTPANGTHTLNVRRAAPEPVVNVFSAILSSGASTVAAHTTGEIIYTLPTGMTLQAGSCTIVNKQSFTANLTVVGARANSSTTLGITFLNNSAAAIIPPTEEYLIANFPTLLPTIGANLSEGQCSMSYSHTFNQMLCLENEMRRSLVTLGLMRGAAA